MTLRKTPLMTRETIRRMEDMSQFRHALIFDDLLIVSQPETCCYVWKTAAGLLMIDAIWPDKAVYKAVIAAISDVGWNPDTLCKLVLTHGHVDHTGCGKWLVAHQAVTTYLSEADTAFWAEHPTKPDRPDTWKDFDIDVYLNDGDTISCGDKSLFVVSTPGHTPGCMSFLFPVSDNGEPHMAALFGGATPPFGNPEGTREYLRSVARFRQAAQEKHADVMLCNHTAFDNGWERIALAAKRLDYLPNDYCLGTDGMQRFFTVFETLGEEQLRDKGE